MFCNVYGMRCWSDTASSKQDGRESARERCKDVHVCAKLCHQRLRGRVVVVFIKYLRPANTRKVFAEQL